MLYTTIGERKQAFGSLEEAFKAHDFQLQYLGVSPEFDMLRDEPQSHGLFYRGESPHFPMYDPLPDQIRSRWIESRQ